MEEILPEQKAQLKTWAGQRDALLSEISNLRTEKEGLARMNKELAFSYTDTTAEINQVIGRIEELKRKEIELIPLQIKENSRLEAEKSRLESEITNLGKILSILSEQKKSFEHDLAYLAETFGRVDNQVSDLDKIVDHVTKVSSDNKHEIESLVANLKKTLGELIDVNTKNVFETNVVIEKLPQMLVEVRKQNLVRNKII